jgi:catechol 2,3-dioxygenase-like lactoylglutathione lyase family enzyme
MIQRLSHCSIFVTDQDLAKDFYVNKLGFEVKTDASMPNGFRWLTVAPKGQSDVEIILMKVGSSSNMSAEDVEAMNRLLKNGALGAGAFHTADCRKTYEELKAKGVKFKSEPKDQFYGIETVMEDPFGNWFSVTQPKGR